MACTLTSTNTTGMKFNDMSLPFVTKFSLSKPSLRILIQLTYASSPKFKNVATVHWFRPISLCNTIYKIITKIIVNRIKPFLDTLIHPTQTSFQQHKRASDNAIIVQEIINKFRTMRGANSSMLLKLDLEKAFDRLEWSFIKYTLTYYNFPTPLVRLIMSCVFTSSISILINSTPINVFKHSSGIRQGDLLSPYLLYGNVI